MYVRRCIEMEVKIQVTEREILENSRQMPRFFLANLKSMGANYKHYTYNIKKKSAISR